MRKINREEARVSLRKRLISPPVQELDPKTSEQMALSLAHTLSRFKLKFSPDKVDTMVIQAIGLLDELDKEINTYAMRAKEWYGWHFPGEYSQIFSVVWSGASILLMSAFQEYINQLPLTMFTFSPCLLFLSLSRNASDRQR